ncbi:phosphatidylglycerophosphatase A [bacterium]|nr:phosphatidylglycerophosphatase A [bacterium]
MFWKIFASLFGLGYLPLAPGTAGSLLTALILYFWIDTMSPWYVVALLLSIPLAALFCHQAGIRWEGDSPHIILDEAMGIMLSFLFIPKGLIIFVLGFVLFRTFDILKPFPVKQMENFNGGLGILLDDLFAGVYTNLCLGILIITPGLSGCLLNRL